MSKARLFIVEDEVIVSADLADRLVDLGYEVVGTAISGTEALSLAEKVRPDLVLMDIHLQGETDGTETAREMRANLQLPVVFLTAFADGPTLERAKLAEPFGYILKPFEDHNLESIIEIALYKHQIELKLQKSEEWHRTILQTAMDGFWLVDMSGKLCEVNETYCQMSGYSQQELLTMQVSDLESGETSSETSSHLEKVRELGHDRFESRHRRKDGTIFDVEVSVIYRPTEGGRMVVFLRDITERNRLESETEVIEEQNRQLQKADSLGRMAGAVAHHFNNQLQSVMGNLELAMDEIGAGEESTLLHEAMNAARKAAEMSDMMRTYLGFVTGKREPMDLAEVCGRCLPVLQGAMSNDIELVADLRSPGPVINANPSHIQQVLSALITNAWESVGSGHGTIRMAVETVSPAEISIANRFPLDWHPHEDAHACMEVRDSGCGIARSDIERLFDPFFSTKFTGRGLGLSVALGIVRAHDGAICVESEVGQGSVFRVYFPLSTAQECPRPSLTAAPRNILEQGGTVLLVEDDAMGRKMAAAMLSHLGFSVLSAKDGIEAIQVFQAHQDEIRVVLCDLTMPRMNGWETLAALRAMSPSIPVVLTSGYDEAHVMDGDHPEKPQAFLHKPYQMATMKSTLARAMAKPTTLTT